MNEADIKHFFSVYKARKESFDENYKYFAPKIAPKFNCFNYIKPNENGLSQIMCDLLDPNGFHEQGTIFLEQFLKTLDKEKIFDFYEKHDFRAILESTTTLIEADNRRIDIELSFGNRFGIAVENKPHSIEQRNQLNHYADQMDKKYKNGNWLLIYLLGYDAQPESIDLARLEALSRSGHFLIIDYSIIILWLRSCAEKCKPPRVVVFIQDFIEHCESRFMGNEMGTENESLVFDYLLSSSNNLELGLEIGKQIDGVKSILAKKFADKIGLRLGDICPDLTVERPDNYGFTSKKNSNLYVYKKDWEHCIGVGFDNYDGFYWGVTKYEKNNRFLEPVEIDKIEKELKQKVKRHPNEKWWYSFIVQFENNYTFWPNQNEAWIEILSGDEKLVEIVVNKINELYKAISKLKVKM